MKDNNLIDLFKDSLTTGFLDKEKDSSNLYRPQLLVNRKIPREKVLSTLIEELENCKGFYFTVAFVTTSGLASLYNTLINLKEKGVKGKVIVSQYLNFTDPLALERLLLFDNIDLRISTKGNSHAKGYIFKHDKYYNIIVGSSNWTANALSENKEWNLKISGLDSSEISNFVLQEFENNFDNAEVVNESYLTKYREIYNNQRLKSRKQDAVLLDSIDYAPNSMQVEALDNLKTLREKGSNKALIISATGTGKTFLSAFDVKNSNARKILFVVHRLNIAKKALETFQSVLKDERTYGLFSGSIRDKNVDYLFTTIQTISKDNHLLSFEKEEFDYIIIDETHRAGAETYRKVLNYFRPNFLLGMTATPERTDGNDIFELFDHNIAYEIRLHRAMEENMLCPFHYFGISDLSINNQKIDDTKDFSKVNIEEKVHKIIEAAKFYGSDSRITRGLVFCSKKNEAIELAKRFNESGLPSIALTGDHKEEDRLQAIKRLESDNIHEKIDYIFTVDIFNEGIDIPKVNQILMIRPTESAIIFIQQLGRGLRKTSDKDYLTVIDFIGNHKNNYLIPIALYGDTSYNKDTIRKLITEGSKLLPGTSTINFDRISKEEIFKSIDASNMKTLSDLKKDYQLLKYRIGRSPMMMDFISNHSRDPFLYVEYSRSYYNFIIKVEKKESEISKESLIILELFSKEINNGKRIEESFLLDLLLKEEEVSINHLISQIKDNYGYTIDLKTIESIQSNINFDFIRKSYELVELKNDTFSLTKKFKQLLTNETFRVYFIDTLNFSITAFNQKYSKESYINGLILNNKYSRKDVCRLLNWEKDISSTVYGYKTVNGVTPCFITYNKSADIEESINYNDHFVNQSVFAWESKGNRKITSNEIKKVIDSNRILLFVKKDDGEGTDFYYLGDVNIIDGSVVQGVKDNKPIVHFKYKLQNEVESNLYKYFTEKLEDDVSSIEIDHENKRDIKYQIPLYNFYAAAGSFSEMQSSKEYEYISCEEKYSTNDYFACKIIGESMNKIIPSQSIAIFKKYTGGSRNGKTVLVEHRDIQDNDFNSEFTVKKYESKKQVTEEGWIHQEIRLKPDSFDSSYKDIIISEENVDGMKIIGEFVTVLAK